MAILWCAFRPGVLSHPCQRINWPPAQGGHAPGRYYFLLPRRRRRARIASEKLVTLCAFGPYVTSDAVNFIRTSALALGLL